MKQYYATEQGNKVLQALDMALTNFQNLAEAVSLETGDTEFKQMIQLDVDRGLLAFAGVTELIQALVGELNLSLVTLEEFLKEYHDTTYQIDYRAYTTAQGMLSDEDGYFVEIDQQAGADDRKAGKE